MRKLIKVWKDNGEREVTTWKKEKRALSNSYKNPEIVKRLLIQGKIKFVNLAGSYLELEDEEDQMVTLTTLNKKIRKKDLESFTRTLFKNRQKDRREKMAKVTGVSKEKFVAYRVVQKSGLTNMLDIRNVIFAADGMCDVILTKEDCFYIMKNYAKLLAEYQ